MTVGMVDPLFLVPKLDDSSTLQDAENEKWCQKFQREAFSMHFHTCNTLYSVQYEFLGRGPGSTLRALGGWGFLNFSRENPKMEQFGKFILDFFKSGLQPQNCDLLVGVLWWVSPT